MKKKFLKLSAIVIVFVLITGISGFAKNSKAFFPRIGLKKAEVREKIVALTFDDGPDERFTPKVLEILKENDIKATFFVVGEGVKKNPEILRQIHENGHEIENHTMTHPYLEKLTKQEVENEIDGCSKEIEKIIGKKPKYFRTPRGNASPDIMSVMKKEKYQMIFWTICLEHKASKTPLTMAKRVIQKRKPGIIILTHDGRLDRSKSLAALPELIKGYKEKGYRFVTIEEMLKIQNHEKIKDKK